MSTGPGVLERRIAELFAATRDRGLTVAEIADHAFELDGATATRAQRLSATRAGHRLIRRMKEAAKHHAELIRVAHRQARQYAGPRPASPKHPKTQDGMVAYEAADARYDAALKATEPWRRAEKLWDWMQQFGAVDQGRIRRDPEFWRATIGKGGTLYFHPPDVPISCRPKPKLKCYHATKRLSRS